MNKIILATANKVDKHGDILTEQALESALPQINGDRKMRYGLNHRRDFPPLGYIVNGEIVKSEGSATLVVEPLLYDKREIVGWDPNLIMEFTEMQYAFVEVINLPSDKLVVSLDKNTFPDFETFQAVELEISKVFNEQVELEGHARKSAELSPELLITISKNLAYGGALYAIIVPIAKKIGDKIGDRASDIVAEQIVDGSSKLLKEFRVKVVRAFKIVRSKVLKNNRKLVTVFDFPGEPHTELIAKTDNPELIIKGLAEVQLTKVKEKTEELMNRVEIDKIQYVLTNNGKWKFNYLLTKDGKTIGTKTVYKERDKMFQRIRITN